MKLADEEENTIQDLHSQERAMKNEYRKARKTNTVQALPPEIKQSVSQLSEKFSSAWLNVVPRKEQKLDLCKGDFNDALRMHH